MTSTAFLSRTNHLPTCVEGEFLRYRQQLDRHQMGATLFHAMLTVLVCWACLKGSTVLAVTGLAVGALGSLLLLLLRLRLERLGWEND